MHDPYRVEPRKRLTDKQRLQLLIANDGRCCICGQPIVGYREQWDDFDLASVPFVDEHVKPLWRDGDNAFSNRGPAHVKCATAKTGQEATERAKGRDVAERHFGAKRSKRPMPFGRRSGKKRKMDGSIVDR